MLLQLLAMSWSCDGTSLCTLGRDHMIRLYKPRESTVPISTVSLSIALVCA